MDKRNIGSQYEALAADYLQKKGLQILERNFRSRKGEIDLIVKDKPYLVFVEVKWRKSDNAGTAEAAVTPGKQRTICRVADYYRYQSGLSEDTPIRFDVVAINGEKIHWIKNAFDYVW